MSQTNLKKSTLSPAFNPQNVQSDIPVIKLVEKTFCGTEIIGSQNITVGSKFHATTSRSGWDDTWKTTPTHEELNDLLQETPVQIKRLEKVTEIHPFIFVVIKTFQVVYALESQRDIHEQKIIAPYIAMRDALLEEIQDVEKSTSNGKSIRERIEKLSAVTAEDVRACANICDTYSKKRPLLQLACRLKWEEKLLECTRLFASRKQEFLLAMTEATIAEIEERNVQLELLKDNIEAISPEVCKHRVQETSEDQQSQGSVVSEGTQNLRSLAGGGDTLELGLPTTNQRYLGNGVEFSVLQDFLVGSDLARHGKGELQEVVMSNLIMQELRHWQKMGNKRDIEELRREVNEDLEVAIKKNSVLFGRDFELRIVEERLSKDDSFSELNGDEIFTEGSGGLPPLTTRKLPQDISRPNPPIQKSDEASGAVDRTVVVRVYKAEASDPVPSYRCCIVQ